MKSAGRDSLIPPGGLDFMSYNSTFKSVYLCHANPYDDLARMACDNFHDPCNIHDNAHDNV